MENNGASDATNDEKKEDKDERSTDDKFQRIEGRNNMSSQDNNKRHSVTICCRICHEDDNLEDLIAPCECSGTSGLIHKSCLEKWLSTSNRDKCEICKYTFCLRKKNKPLTQSFWLWWKSRNINGPQGLTGDIICLTILTPLCIAATYLCGIGASAYNRLGFWEGTGLGVLCCMLIGTYCLWLVVTLRFHFKSWTQWRRRNQNVHLVLRKPGVLKTVKPPKTQSGGNACDNDHVNNRLDNIANHNNNNRSCLDICASLLGSPFTNSEIPSYATQEEISTLV